MCIRDRIIIITCGEYTLALSLHSLFSVLSVKGLCALFTVENAVFEARLSEGEAGTWMGVRDGEELTEYPLELRDTELGRPRGRGDRVCKL